MFLRRTTVSTRGRESVLTSDDVYGFLVYKVSPDKIWPIDTSYTMCPPKLKESNRFS